MHSSWQVSHSHSVSALGYHSYEFWKNGITSSTSWLLFIFCLQQVYKHLSASEWSQAISCEVYRVERGAGLYCIARGNTVCFTLDRMLRGPHSCLDTKGKKISSLHQGTIPYIGWAVRNIYKIPRKIHVHLTSWSRLTNLSRYVPCT